jgi:hypothetical protein
VALSTRALGDHLPLISAIVDAREGRKLLCFGAHGILNGWVETRHSGPYHPDQPPRDTTEQDSVLVHEPEHTRGLGAGEGVARDTLSISDDEATLRLTRPGAPSPPSPT